MNQKPSKSWEEVRESLEITPEQEAEIQLEKDFILACVAAREKAKLTQRDLSEKSGLKQSSIAKIEKFVNSPNTRTAIKYLHPMGYTIRVVPLADNRVGTH